MIQINRTSKTYADNVIDPYLVFKDAQTWTVSSGTGTGQTDNTYSFVDDYSLRIENTAPTKDIVITNATQNTVIPQAGYYGFSLYIYKLDSADDYSGEIKIFKNAVLLDTQTWDLADTEVNNWYRFQCDSAYLFTASDVITFTFQLDGIVGKVTPTTVWFDGLHLYPANDRLDFTISPLYTLPTEHVPLQHFGLYDYDDDATSTTPIALVANTWTHVTNDGAGTNTNTTYKLTDVDNIYNVGTGLFDFSDLELGDTVEIRFDAEITTSGANQTCDVDLVLAYGTVSEYRIPFIRNEFKTAAAHNINRSNKIYMGNTATLNNAARFEIRSDGTADVEVKGWFCTVNKRLV